MTKLAPSKLTSAIFPLPDSFWLSIVHSISNVIGRRLCLRPCVLIRVPLILRSRQRSLLLERLDYRGIARRTNAVTELQTRVRCDVVFDLLPIVAIRPDL